MRKVLTDEQIKEAKNFRICGKTKRELAKMYGVSETAIWENVFSNKKRFRVYFYKKKEKDNRPVCEICTIKLTREVKYPSYIPPNFAINSTCIMCLMSQMGFDYQDLYKI